MNGCGLCGSKRLGELTRGCRQCAGCGSWTVVEPEDAALPWLDDREVNREDEAFQRERTGEASDVEAERGFGRHRRDGG